MSKAPLLPVFTNERGYFGTDYPIQMVPTPANPFILIACDKKGLYAGCHDTAAKELIQFTFELKPGYKETSTATVPIADEIGGLPVHMEFTVIHFPFASPGESIKLSPIIINPYAGSWHKGVDFYKKWRGTWFTPPHTADWARDIHSWQQIHINSPEDELRCQYKDLVKYGEDCARHGVKAIQLVGWNNGGQDRGNPSHDTDSRLGTWEELRDAIDKIQDMGVKIILFTKFTWADRSLEWFKRDLVKYAARDPYGDYNVFQGWQYQTPTQLSDIYTRRLVPMCMNSKEWRDICSDEFKKGIELGAAGMLYDECQHHGGTYYCFDSTHKHHIPVNIYSGDALLCEDFHGIADKISPDYLFAGEACYDLENRHYSISYSRIRTLGHIALQRYIDPYAGILVAVYGYDDRNVLNQCLLYRYIISYEPLNFKGRLDEFPLTIEYGKKIDALRKRYKNFLWDAEFIDTLEAQVTA
ncbi:MAG: hypothetical protein FIA99_18185, partial [Ruminiclostridium sp.]|nr:hypothetical protein [Ruminiclostridium sp.]